MIQKSQVKKLTILYTWLSETKNVLLDLISVLQISLWNNDFLGLLTKRIHTSLVP